MDGSLQLNAATYYYVWDDQQIFFVGPNGPEFANIDESELTGFELEFQWAPAEGWYISGGIGVMDTEITKSSDPGAAQKGHELAFAADRSANLIVIKEIPLGNGVLSLQADYQYQSAPKAYYIQKRLVDELEELSIVNARVSYVFGDSEQYEVAFYGQNLSEEESCSYKWDLTVMSGTAYCVANEAAAFYGIQGRWNF
jgi:iron complex outermembrane receptor protein